MRPLADGPYEIVTYLQRPHAQADSVAERFRAQSAANCRRQAPRCNAPYGRAAITPAIG
jgi:hypothetical protein